MSKQTTWVLVPKQLIKYLAMFGNRFVKKPGRMYLWPKFRSKMRSILSPQLRETLLSSKSRICRQFRRFKVRLLVRTVMRMRVATMTKRWKIRMRKLCKRLRARTMMRMRMSTWQMRAVRRMVRAEKHPMSRWKHLPN